jgi:transposase-like protein
MSFKLQIVQEIERGQLSTTELLKYGIQCRKTVVQWLRKYGSFDWESHHLIWQNLRQKIMELEQSRAFRETKTF